MDMLKFVKQKSNEIQFILVYSMDRFSRTGDEAMTIVYELRKNQIYVQSVTQVSDQETAEGELQQNMNLIFAKYDNECRRRKTIAGMREYVGRWCSKPPRGYSKKDGELVINMEGEPIKKAL
ncbi:MAG: recombinase family protein [Bacteroidetes bacterium]|nr:recombinase family protein [Bacteroidota bacterium]